MSNQTSVSNDTVKLLLFSSPCKDINDPSSTTTTATTTTTKHGRKILRHLGVVQISIGILWMFYSMEFLTDPSDTYSIVHGILGGVVFFLAGTITIISGGKKQDKSFLCLTAVVCAIIVFSGMMTIVCVVDKMAVQRNNIAKNYAASNASRVDMFYDLTIALATIATALVILRSIGSIVCWSFRYKDQSVCMELPEKNVNHSGPIEKQNFTQNSCNKGYILLPLNQKFGKVLEV